VREADPADEREVLGSLDALGGDGDALGAGERQDGPNWI
jgi:hypothetical protein